MPAKIEMTPAMIMLLNAVCAETLDPHLGWVEEDDYATTWITLQHDLSSTGEGCRINWGKSDWTEEHATHVNDEIRADLGAPRVEEIWDVLHGGAQLVCPLFRAARS